MVAVGEGMLNDFGMVMCTLLYLKWITNRAYSIAHEPLLSVMWQPGWERELEEIGLGFPGDGMVKNPSTNVGDASDADSTCGLGRSPGEGNVNPLQ